MKKIGFIMIALALVIGLLLPWVQLNFFDGEEITSVEFTSFNQTPVHESTVLLKTADNPVRLRFFAKYKVAGLLPPVKVPVQLKVSDKNGTLLGAIISFPTDGRGSAPEQQKVTSGSNVLLNVQNDGLHKIELSFAPNKNDNGITNPDVDSIRMTFIGNAVQISDEYKIPAAVLAILGFYLIIRSRRNKPTTPKKPRWGRGAK